MKKDTSLFNWLNDQLLSLDSPLSSIDILGTCVYKKEDNLYYTDLHPRDVKGISHKEMITFLMNTITLKVFKSKSEPISRLMDLILGFFGLCVSFDAYAYFEENDILFEIDGYGMAVETEQWKKDFLFSPYEDYKKACSLGTSEEYEKKIETEQWGNASLFPFRGEYGKTCSSETIKENNNLFKKFSPEKLLFLDSGKLGDECFLRFNQFVAQEGIDNETASLNSNLLKVVRKLIAESNSFNPCMISPMVLKELKDAIGGHYNDESF